MRNPEEFQLWLDETYEKLCTKMKAECARVGSNIPYFPYEGRYVDCMMPDGISWWTNGFWPGMLWQMYHATEDEQYRFTAEKAEIRLAKALEEYTKLHHDVGFMFLPSAVANWRLTGNQDSLRIGLHAASLLAGRFNPSGNYIRAWNESIWKEDVSGWMIADCLLNLPLLYWASEVTKDPRFADIADRHAATALHSILRPDGSCNHIAEFDPSTGEFVKGVGGQGYGEGSSWSRGQGWAVYGFALSYRHTQKAEYLNAAKSCAHYCISNLALNNWLPPVDFRAPAEPLRYDASAAAIIACGLLEIAEHVPEFEKPLYENAAKNMLKACDMVFTDWNPETDGFLLNSAMMYHNDQLGERSFIYGDYFYLEAILRLKGKHMMIW